MKKKILVADDDITIADLLTTALDHEGYETQKTIQSLRFYDAVIEYQPDLILLDLMMPYLEGEDELRLLQMREDTKRIPVIVVTAKHDAMRDAAHYKSLGVVEIVTKPFQIDHLVSLIQQTIG